MRGNHELLHIIVRGGNDKNQGLRYILVKVYW